MRLPKDLRRQAHQEVRDFSQRLTEEGGLPEEAWKIYKSSVNLLFRFSKEGKAFTKKSGQEFSSVDLLLNLAERVGAGGILDLKPEDLETILFQVLPKHSMLPPAQVPILLAEFRAFWKFLEREFEVPFAGFKPLFLKASERRLLQAFEDSSRHSPLKSFLTQLGLDSAPGGDALELLAKLEGADSSGGMPALGLDPDLLQEDDSDWVEDFLESEEGGILHGPSYPPGVVLEEWLRVYEENSPKPLEKITAKLAEASLMDWLPRSSFLEPDHASSAWFELHLFFRYLAKRLGRSPKSFDRLFREKRLDSWIDRLLDLESAPKERAFPMLGVQMGFRTNTQVGFSRWIEFYVDQNLEEEYGVFPESLESVLPEVEKTLKRRNEARKKRRNFRPRSRRR